MKTTNIIIIGLAMCAGANSALALEQKIQIVVPGELATVEGNSSVMEPFTSTSFRFQQVFDASQFDIPEGMYARIDSISFRIDGGAGRDVAMSFGGSSIQLYTISRGPDELSAIFAENRGKDGFTVGNGGVSFGGVYHPGQSPQPWQFMSTLPINRPFYYDPSKGNLLLEVAGVDGLAFIPGTLDGHSIQGDSISWVVADSNLASSGNPSTFGLATQFGVTLVPEPSVTALMCITLGFLTLYERSGRSSRRKKLGKSAMHV